MEWRTRPATPDDARAISAIYNEGIADRIATFETEPRSGTDIVGWFTGSHLVVVAETGETSPIAFAASFPYSSRCAGSPPGFRQPLMFFFCSEVYWSIFG